MDSVRLLFLSFLCVLTTQSLLAQAPNPDDGVVCTGGGTDDFPAWQVAVEDYYATQVTGSGYVVYSTVTPIAGSTMPDGIVPDGVHSSNPGCSSEVQTVSAYAFDDVDGNGSDSSGDTYDFISTYTLTVYPIPDAENPAGGECTDTVIDNCGGLDILYSTNGFATPGSPIPPSLFIFSPDVTVSWTASIPGAPAGCEATGMYELTCPFLDILDPCNCDLGLDLNMDGTNEYAQEIITIDGAPPFTNVTLTGTGPDGGLYDYVGGVLVPLDATTIQPLIVGPNSDGDYTITAYRAADNVSTYTFGLMDVSGLMDSITGEPCPFCPSTCTASNGTLVPGPSNE